jgi:hypothetical protein
MAALRALREDSNLLCVCVSQPCHAQVVEQAWYWLRDQGRLGTVSGGATAASEGLPGEIPSSAPEEQPD